MNGNVLVICLYDKSRLRYLILLLNVFIDSALCVKIYTLGGQENGMGFVKAKNHGGKDFDGK